MRQGLNLAQILELICFQSNWKQHFVSLLISYLDVKINLSPSLSSRHRVNEYFKRRASNNFHNTVHLCFVINFFKCLLTLNRINMRIAYLEKKHLGLTLLRCGCKISHYLHDPCCCCCWANSCKSREDKEPSVLDFTILH